jgi:hypothetical protein
MVVVVNMTFACSSSPVEIGALEVSAIPVPYVLQPPELTNFRLNLLPLAFNWLDVAMSTFALL